MKKIKLFLLIGTLFISTPSLFAQNGLDFDGTNDYIQTTSNGVVAAIDRTFEAWIYIPNSPSSNLAILDYGANVVGSRNTFIVNPNLALGFISGGTNANISSVSNAIPVGQWVHVAFVLDNGTGFLYVNGAQVGTGSLSSVFTPLGTALRIGERVAGGSIPFEGKIDEVRIWNTAKTQQELTANMNNELCGIPADLVAYYKLNEGIAGGTNTSVTTALDEVSGTNDGTLTNFALTGATSNWVTGAALGPPTVFNNQTLNECAGFSITIGTNTYNTTGIYSDTLLAASANGCDSIINTNLTIATIINNQTLNECTGFSITVGTNTYNTTGIYSDTLIAASANGCDSIVNTNLNIGTASTNNQTLNECAGFSITIGTNTYNTTGIYSDTLIAANGCDSIINTNLTITTIVNNQTLNECAGFSITIGTNTYNTTGIYSDTLLAAAANGCDSIINTNLTITTIINNQTLNECAGFSITIGTNTYNTTGIYSDTLLAAAANGCDSIITLNLTIDSLDNSVTNAGDSLFSNQANATSYQWLDCNNNYAPIVGATTSMFHPTQAGNYAVAIVNGSCSDTSNCELITSIEQINTNHFFVVYPNPAQNELTITVDQQSLSDRVQIFNVNGILVQEILIQNKTTLVDVSKLTTGVYFIQYGSNVQKLILSE